MAWTESHLGGSGSGASYLEDLGDVALSSLTDNQLLKYNASSGKWENSSGDGQKFQPVIYSTEEREIGVWTDGKPLYQKTYVFETELILVSNIWTYTDIPNTGIDKIISFEAMNNSGTNLGFLGVNRDSYETGTIGILNTRNTNTPCKIFTIQYTKTTDTPGSGTWTPQGVPAVHYSTDEQIIGTWVDGSTIYERVFVLGSELNISCSSWTTTTITGVAQTINAFGIGGAGSQYPLMSRVINNTVDLLACRYNENAYCYYIYLRYTKSSS